MTPFKNYFIQHNHMKEKYINFKNVCIIKNLINIAWKKYIWSGSFFLFGSWIKLKHNTCSHTPSLLPQLYRSKFSLSLSICNQGKLIHILNIFILKLEHTSHYNPINNSRPISCKQFNVTFLFSPVWSLPL